jgi:hypothetical protein
MLTPDQNRELERRLKCHRRGYYTHREAERLFAQLARPDSLAELLSRTPSVFAEAIRQAAGCFRPVRAVGYWRSTLGPCEGTVDRLPHPADLVTPGWLAGNRDRIISYLRAGRTFAEWRGLSYCRFRCATDIRAMGSRCLTDGEWVWPEGLAHYIECHEVRLPQEFVDGMRERGWEIALEESGPTAATQGEPDFAFWLAWSEMHLGTQGTPASRVPRARSS